MAIESTAFTGTPLSFTFDRALQPGSPRSRENAKHMRDALVRQATPQNSCPIVEISTTTLVAAQGERRVEDGERAAAAVVHRGRRRWPRT